MIVKELDPFLPTADPRERAGRVAEEQMAFYLRRAFGTDPEVHVLHGLRLEHAGDAAQIDHLLLHRWGMLLIESKSVTTRVRVNAQGEWMRQQTADWCGMRSPVSQVELQAEFLRARLREHTSELLGKLLGLQVHFGRMPLDTFIAISDEGIIEREGSALLRVYKADQVCSQVKSLIALYRKANSPLGLWTSKEEYFWHTLLPAETARLLEFLCHQHRPLHTASAPALTQPFVSTPSDLLPFSIRKHARAEQRFSGSTCQYRVQSCERLRYSAGSSGLRGVWTRCECGRGALLSGASGAFRHWHLLYDVSAQQVSPLNSTVSSVKERDKETC